MNRDLEVAHCSADAVVGSVAGVLLQRWYRRASEEAIRATGRAHDQAFRDRPSGVGVLAVVDPTVGLPDGDARRLAASIAERTRGEVRAHASVILGDGFWASAVRSALTGIFAVSRVGYPRKIFSDVAPAIAWLNAALAEDGVDRRQLLAHALAELDAREIEASRASGGGGGG